MPSNQEKEAMAIEEEELELERKELEMKKKQLELRKRKAGVKTDTRPAKGGQAGLREHNTLEQIFPTGNDSNSGPVKPINPRKLKPGEKEPDYKWRNLALVMMVPIIGLAATVAFMRYTYDEAICPRPCEGICNITKDMIAQAPKGCMPEEPMRLLFNVVPGTSAEEILVPMMHDLAHAKEFEFVKMRPWRDVGTHEPVFLSPVSKSTMKQGAYDALYMQMNFNLINVNPNYTECSKPKKFIAGKSYFHDLRPEDASNITVREDPIRHVIMLRDPMERFRDQLAEEWQKRNDANKFANKNDMFDKLDLQGCLDVKPCRHARKLGRWCNLQTRMVCGWHRDCGYDYGREVNATQKMLDKALENLEANYSTIMIAEEWDLSIQLLEATHPTYFEGLTEANSKVEPPYCKTFMGEQVCPKNANPKTTAPIHKAHRDMLKDHCWADTILYEKAKEIFYKKAEKCGLKADAPK